jgi:5-methylcytosine-specific restriction endonuclease McrA
VAVTEDGEGPDFPDLDSLWQQMVRDAPRREVEDRPWIEQQVCDAIRRARRGHDHMTAVDIRVLVAQCTGCAYSEARATEGMVEPPDIFGSDLTTGYEAIGLTRKQIKAVKKAIEEGSWSPRCYYWCGSRIDVIGEGFHVRRASLSAYFGLDAHEGRKPPEWMRDAVLRGFGGRCGGCRRRLTPTNTTLDHIVAKSKGGLTEMTNLQPLCERCNGKKGDSEVEVVDVVLTFPLRPAPSDGFEGVIW